MQRQGQTEAPKFHGRRCFSLGSRHFPKRIPTAVTSILSLLPFPFDTDADNDADATNSLSLALPENYQLYLVEASDLPAIAQLTVDVFDATVIRLSSELSRIERAVFAPPVMAWNALGDFSAFVEVLTGLRQRLATHELVTQKESGTRWISPQSVSDPSALVGHSSLVLAIASSHHYNDKDDDKDDKPTVVATVEVQVQYTDAKVPMSLPLVDRIERGLQAWLSGGGDDNAAKAEPVLQPYLNNLAVTPTHRQRGLAKALVQVVEWIAFSQWNYDVLYLHVDVENTAAMKLYQTLGYDQVQQVQWTPPWSLDSSAPSKVAYLAKSKPRNPK